jgi:hypothetical protein
MNILTVMHEIQLAFLGVTLQYKRFLQSPLDFNHMTLNHSYFFKEHVICAHKIQLRKNGCMSRRLLRRLVCKNHYLVIIFAQFM